MLKRIALLLPLLLACSLPCFAQKVKFHLVTPGQVEIEALRGLLDVNVEVKSDVRRKGYEPDTLREAIEGRLKAEGVPVVASDKPAAGNLKVTLSSLGDVVLIRLRLVRIASLLFCDDCYFLTPMWERERLGRGDVMPDVAFLVESFAADYNSLNRR